jgi:hypothetical protein
MNIVNRRVFLATATVGICTIHRYRLAQASSLAYGNPAPLPPQIALANALNFSSFVQNKENLALSGMMAIRPVDGKAGRYPASSLFLFPFNSGNSQASSAAAFLPGLDAASPLTATAPMTTRGLPPDEYFCHYVIQAPPQGFISCEVGAPIAHSDSRGPWHGNVMIAGEAVGFRWTSSNLNYPWFGGSRWIPDNDDGTVWRNRFIEGVRQAASLASGAGGWGALS